MNLYIDRCIVEVKKKIEIDINEKTVDNIVKILSEKYLNENGEPTSFTVYYFKTLNDEKYLMETVGFS